MKRDLDLVRKMLIFIEESDGRIPAEDVMDLASNRERGAFHLRLIVARGLVSANLRSVTGPQLLSGFVEGLTWDGFDYLDAIRSEPVWSRAKEAIRESVGDTSLSVVKQVCSSLALSMVKNQLGI